jgi:hypothetical protein
LAQAGAEVFWLKGSAVVSPAFAKPRGVMRQRATVRWGHLITEDKKLRLRRNKLYLCSKNF